MPDLTKKCFKNDICKECISRNIKKYGKFEITCDGIETEKDVNLAIKEGLTEEEARWLFDPAYFFEKVYGHKPRWYQHRILYCTARQLAGRQCRQTGKTLLFMYKILHYVQTNKNKTVLVLAPRENQVKKIWDEYILRDAVNRSDTIKASVTGKVMSPYYQITFDNGSKIILMIAGPGARGQSADWVYIDEAAMISSDMLSDILMTIAGKGADDATILMTSTPMGRGNVFYDACKTNSEFNEYHVSIHEVEEMKNQIPKFKKLLGDTGFIQECEAEFPDASGGPFNYKGIDLSKYAYEYENATKEPGWLYFGGVDWNGPNIGTYFYVVAFNPETYHIKVVDKAVVSSAVWNSTVAKQKFIELNRKWNPKHWMTDFGYGHCLDPNTKITTINGIKKIKDINIGDYVLTHSNCFKKVINKFTPNIEKKTYTIVPMNHEAIIASEDHRFLIKRLNNRFKSKQEELLLEPKWVKVKDINKEVDFVAVPKLLTTNRSTKIIDLYDFLKDDIQNLKYDDKYIWLNNSYSKLKGFSLKKIAESCNSSTATITRIRRKFFNGTFDYTKNEKLIVDKYSDIIFQESPIIKVNRYIDILDKDFLNFIGFFIAEGNLSHKGIEITQYESNLGKSDFYNKMEKFSKILNLEYNIYKTKIDVDNLGIVKKTNNEFKYRGFFFGEIINKLMIKLTGKICDKKIIHNEILFSGGNLLELVNGICRGDGHTYINSSNARVNSITTTSPDIAYQIRDILISNGILPSLKSYDSEGYKTQYIVSYIDYKEEDRRHNRSYVDSEKYLYVPIVKIDEKEITQDLLDITVEDDHSFIANGVITHNSINEELKYWSTYKLAPDIPGNHPDAMLKHTIEPVDFGSWTEIKDPFTGEELKKTTKSFIVSQVSRLFEPFGDSVSITISETDNELIKSLENYKLLQITDKGVEKYGFDKKDDIEDHCLDSFSLAVYGIVKHYSELFEQIFLISVPIDARSILRPVSDIDVNTIPHGSNIILITDNSPEPIELDGSKIKDIEDEAILPIIARTFNKNIVESRPTLNSIMKRRNSYVISRSLNI